MSGPFGSSQWMYSSGGFYPTELEQSLRFNDDDSAYLSWTPASAGNRKTWTFSAWVKRGNLGSFQTIFSAGASSPSYDIIRFTDADKLQFVQEGGTAGANLITNAVFRDASAWYHVVVKLNSTSSEAAIFVNGVEQTVTGSQPTNTDRAFSNSVIHAIGTLSFSPQLYADCYIAEVNFIDGQALDPTSFGEFKSGVWVANEYTGSYGTNGFYLNFSDSANIGDDLSGNANDWTANNLVATDVVLDSPTQNWATLNAVSKASAVTLSQGNLGYSCGDTNKAVTATFAASSGKWYWEILATASTGGSSIVGIVNELFALEGFFASTSGGYGYSATASKWNNGSASSYGATWTNGDLIGVALDLDAGTLTFYKNNASQGVAFTGISGFFSPVVSGQSGTAYALNFGQDSSFAGNKTAQGNTDDNGVGDFYYAPPSGYLALCTANLPDPVIDPAQDDVPSDYFNTVLYTGDGTSSNAITGVGFQPDFVWGKARSEAHFHTLVDQVRGAGKLLFSNSTAVEETGTALTSFDVDGFTVGSQGNALNNSGASYVAWNWLAGNGTSSNTSGSITSTVSVNQKAGFSVVGYTGTGANATVGHGLGVVPKMVVVKRRDATGDWPVWNLNVAVTGSDRVVFLNTTDAQTAAATNFNSSSPTTSVINVGTNAATNASAGTYIAYCFAEVEGYSKFGSYTGNGSTDGPFVYCGFRPAFVMVKRTDSTGSWRILDNARDGFNPKNELLLAEDSVAEQSYVAREHELLSNGFKIRHSSSASNASGGTYIFMAFAEMPFRYSNAR